MHPYIILVINVLMCVNIIIRVDIGHVVIAGMVITHRAPIRLTVYVYPYTKTNLRIGYFE